MDRYFDSSNEVNDNFDGGYKKKIYKIQAKNKTNQIKN